MPSTYCLYCDEEFSIGKSRIGAEVKCANCGMEHEVISVNPLEVDFPLESYDNEEWWDDDE